MVPSAGSKGQQARGRWASAPQGAGAPPLCHTRCHACGGAGAVAALRGGRRAPGIRCVACRRARPPASATSRLRTVRRGVRIQAAPPPGLGELAWSGREATATRRELGGAGASRRLQGAPASSMHQPILQRLLRCHACPRVSRPPPPTPFRRTSTWTTPTHTALRHVALHCPDALQTCAVAGVRVATGRWAQLADRLGGHPDLLGRCSGGAGPPGHCPVAHRPWRLAGMAAAGAAASGTSGEPTGRGLRNAPSTLSTATPLHCQSLSPRPPNTWPVNSCACLRPSLALLWREAATSCKTQRLGSQKQRQAAAGSAWCSLQVPRRAVQSHI